MRVSLSYDLLRVSSCQTILITRTAMSRTPQQQTTLPTNHPNSVNNPTTKLITCLNPSTPTFTNPPNPLPNTKTHDVSTRPNQLMLWLFTTLDFRISPLSARYADISQALQPYRFFSERPPCSIEVPKRRSSLEQESKSCSQTSILTTLQVCGVISRRAAPSSVCVAYLLLEMYTK
jgi:hypothetical protein